MEETRARMQEAGWEIGESCEQGAETYHDNAPYEEAVRSFSLSSWQLSELQKIRGQVRVVDPPAVADKAKIGVRVRIKDLETQEELSVRIASYIVFDQGDISYRSPLAKILIGAVAGDVKSGVISGKKKRFQIMELSL